MGDRSVSVFLKANVTSYVASIEKAKLATTDFAKSAEKSATVHKDSWNKVGRGMLITGGFIAAGVGLAVKTFMDFDKSMSRAQAGTMATGSSLAALRKAAIDAGAATQFSATDAADAITAMGKAGVSTHDILGGGLNGALSLAAAGELDVGSAAEIAATAMNQFGLSGKDIPHIADLLAAGAGKAMGSVDDLAGALKYAGVVAKDAGWSIEETTGVLAEFAQAGIVGEQAGTSLRGVIMSLSSPSAIAAKTMAKYSISMYDANGHMLKAAPLAQQLREKLGTLDEATRNQALGQIFGNEQITAARVLYRGGAAAVEDWTKKSNDAGYATRQAAMLTNNLSGDVERLGGSLSSVLIVSGSATNGMLRAMTKGLQGAVDGFGALPVPAQKTALGVAAVASAGLLAAGAFISVVPKIQATKKALDAMSISSGRSGAALRGLGKAAGIAAGLYAVSLAIAAISNATGTTIHGVEATTAALLKTGDSVKNVDALFAGLDSSSSPVNDLATAFTRLTDKSWVDTMSDGADALVGAANGGTKAAEQFGNLGQALGALVTDGHAPAAKAQFDAMAQSLGLTGPAVQKLRDLMPAYGEAIAGVANKSALATTPMDGLAKSTGGVSVSAADAAKAVDDLKARIEGFGSVTLDARGAARDYAAALDGATTALHDNGRTLDTNTDKGRANQSALEAIRTAALKSAVANYTNGASLRSVTGQVATARGEFVSMATKMGMSRSAANTLATQLGLTRDNVKRLGDAALALPKNPKVTVTAATKLAQSQLAAVQARLDRLTDKTVTVHVAASFAKGLSGYAGKAADNVLHPVLHPASGGYVTGAGSGTSDSIPAMLSNGEFVINAASTKRIGLDVLHAANKFAAGGPVGVQSFAGGGFVQANLSGIGSTIPTSSPTTSDLAAARLRQAKATVSLHAAEAALYALRRTKGHTTAQVNLDEQRLANARGSLTAATSALRGVEAARTVAASPYSTKFHAAAAKSTAATAAFLTNVSVLRKRGFGVLADQLVMAADDQAYTLAGQAVRSTAVARTLTGDVGSSLRADAALAAAQAAVSGPGQPAWALPTMAASSYGARPAPPAAAAIYVQNPFTGEYLLAQVGGVVDGHTQTLVNGLIYGGG